MPEVGNLVPVGNFVVHASFEGWSFGDVDHSFEGPLGHRGLGGPAVHHHLYFHEIFSDAAYRSSWFLDGQDIQRAAASLAATRL